MDGLIVSGYDVLVVIWGMVFIAGAVGFIYGMNRLFQAEDRRQASSQDLAVTGDHADSRPLRPAA
jgi:hypothetical protein